MIAALITIVPSIFGWYRAKKEAQMVWYKIIWEAICNITVFVIKNFWAITKFIAFMYVILQWHAEADARKASDKLVIATQAKYDAHLEDDKKAHKVRAAEIKAKDAQAAREIAALEAQHKIDKSNILMKGKKHEEITDSMLIAARDALRLSTERQAAAAAARLPRYGQGNFTEEYSNTTVLGLLEGLKQTEEELAVCQEAGAYCAADYNYCYGYVKSQQSIIGVKKD
jgi:hypothetical protein